VTNERIAITGAGLVTPLGDTPLALHAALLEKKRAIAPLASPLAEEGAAGEARIADFDATRYANVRGMRLYGRATRLGICATKLALVDAGHDAASGGTALPAVDLGIVAATGNGYLETAIEYDRGLATVGPQHTNPALMPIALPSAPGAAIALGFGAKAFSITLADGGASSLDALALGARLLASGRAAACVVVGAFTPAAEAVLAAFRAGALAPADAFRVLDRAHRGTAFGEAGAALVLEPLTRARARGAKLLGVLAGFGTTFTPAPSEPASAETALARACEKALSAAGWSGSDVGLVSAGANGAPAGDRAEAAALARVLGQRGDARTPVTAVKAGLGESVDAAGMVQAIAALVALGEKVAPPIAGLEEPEVAGLGYALAPAAIERRRALVTARSESGSCAALLLSCEESDTHVV
jgi:3-oxoacyl-[acyl-carrier-protein] synthase II